MRSFFYRLPLILLFFGSLAYAQEEVLTKEEAIDLVLENNLDIQVARNTKTIDENNAGIDFIQQDVRGLDISMHHRILAVMNIIQSV